MLNLAILRSKPVRTEILGLFASLLFTLAYNGAFWSALTSERNWSSVDTWYLVFFTGVLITGLQWLLFLLVLNRWTAKPLLILLAMLTAPAVYFMTHYGVPLNKSMLQNLLETDIREASEFLDWKLLLYLLGYGILPSLVLWNIEIIHSGKMQAAAISRAGFILAALLMIGIGVWPIMNQLVPAMREHKELRFLITPSNYLVSMGEALADLRQTRSNQPLLTIARDAHRNKNTTTAKPKAFILVIGETVRADNWGLNGYARQTTPELAALEVINFRDVTSCGTDTATSLPCMFSIQGRHNFDAGLIHDSESLLHVMNRTGITVYWRENQAGCKGVCDSFLVENLSSESDPSLCNGERCFDGILLRGIKEKIEFARGDVLIVLHMLGNHGPAYYQRYPEEFRRFTPTCDTTDLASCSRVALINTYDNAILYTDHVLAKLIADLKGITTHDTGMLYVSDHGESLGENNLYLHGIPHVFAPREQTHVPMIMWISPDFMADQQLDGACLDRLASTQAVSHDYLIHTLLQLFDIQTMSYEPALDLTATCTAQPLQDLSQI